jgi:endonuclease YncB( thermonuclease family)
MRVQVWIDQSVETLVRVNGIDTPELKGKCAGEREKAQAARKKAEAFLTAGRAELRNVRLEKYAGRVLADVHGEGGQSLAAYMIESGYARPYAGAKRLTWCGG